MIWSADWQAQQRQSAGANAGSDDRAGRPEDTMRRGYQRCMAAMASWRFTGQIDKSRQPQAAEALDSVGFECVPQRIAVAQTALEPGQASHEPSGLRADNKTQRSGSG